MNQRQIPKGFDTGIFRKIFGAIADVAQKTFFEEQKRERCNSFNFSFVTSTMQLLHFLKRQVTVTM
jgi:hypothetical protein